jgi:ribonuclease P protein component
MRLPRASSINQREIFDRVRKTGQSKAGRFVIVSTLADADLASIRTGFITSRRSAKKAHDRVLIRRRLRALVQAHAPGFVDLKRYLVVIARQGAATADFAELEADWLRQVRRLGLFPKDEPRKSP